MTDPESKTTLLHTAAEGESAGNRLLPLVSDQLRQTVQQMANDTPGRTLELSILVQEVFQRLVGSDSVRWQNGRHFYAAAAQSIRLLLVNSGTLEATAAHGSGQRQALGDHLSVVEPPVERLLLLDAALKKLEAIDSRKGLIVMLRYFAGQSMEETAKALDLSPNVVNRDWEFARTWLHREMST